MSVCAYCGQAGGIAVYQGIPHCSRLECLHRLEQATRELEYDTNDASDLDPPARY